MTEHRFDRRATPAAIQAAATWFARLRGPEGRRVRPAYARWRLRNAARAKVAAEIDDVWGLAGALADDPAIRELVDNAPSAAPTRCGQGAAWTRRAAALAVFVLAGAAGGGLALHFGIGAPVRSEVYQTAQGEQRSVTLSDGSTIRLDTATRLTVEMRSRRRDIRLAAGGARFIAARDPSRPFVVEAGPARVEALGTVFDVRLDAGATAVNLFKGAVEVRNTGQGSVRPVRLAPGDGVRVSASAAPLAVARFDIDGAWGWSDGRLVFAGASLADVASELNRYGPGRMVVTGAGGQRFRGELKAGDVDGAAAVLSALYDLSVRRAPNGDVVLAPR
ncbi:hypothetical protein AS593_13300 [Caulobacter vibrioides]|nr:hypothetical protein AS593_13300 [Caulobacter vibrioides]